MYFVLDVSGIYMHIITQTEHIDLPAHELTQPLQSNNKNVNNSCRLRYT